MFPLLNKMSKKHQLILILTISLLFLIPKSLSTEFVSTPLFFTTNGGSPILKLIAPSNNQQLTTSSQDLSVTFSFSYSSLDSDVGNCTLYLSKHSSFSQIYYSRNIYPVNPPITISFSRTLPLGNYFWKVYCIDSTGDNSTSSINKFSLSLSQPSKTGGKIGGSLPKPTPEPPAVPPSPATPSEPSPTPGTARPAFELPISLGGVFSTTVSLDRKTLYLILFFTIAVSFIAFRKGMYKRKRK